MLANQLAVGTIIKFPLSVRMETKRQERAVVSLDAGPFGLTLASGKRTSAVLLDHVPYAPGGINYCESDGEVLSGIFTGCVMTAYMSGGKRHVAHVHTGDDAGEGLDCKSLMGTMLSTGGCSELASFKPYRRTDEDLARRISTKAGDPFGCATFGLISRANECYSVYTRKVTKHEYVIEKVEARRDRYSFA